MMNNRIKELQEEIEKEKRKMLNCRRESGHDFGESFHNPLIIKEPISFTTVGQGRDVWLEPNNYRNITKDRWTRTYKKCGFEQHTEKKKSVIVKEEPDFG